MNSFRYDTSNHWYKGNAHIHSRASDGGRTFREIAELYATAGYDFLFRTDHWVFSDTTRDAETHPLLWLDGVELDGQDDSGAYFHVVSLGLVRDVPRTDGLLAACEAARTQGALLVLAHPHWCGNSLEDSRRWPFDGVEIYNHICRWLNGKGEGLVFWEAMLKTNPNTLAFAVDDAHLYPNEPSGWNGGWIRVNATHCSPSPILAAIRQGNFYSSCGPEIHSMTFDGTHLHLRTSPVRFIRLVGPGALGLRPPAAEGQLFTDVTLPIPLDWAWVYLDIEDPNGKRAWTNPLFVSPVEEARTQ